MPFEAIRMAKVLMRAIKVEGVHDGQNGSQPRETLGSFINRVTWRLWRLVVAQNSRRFFFATTRTALLRIVTAIR